MTISAYLRNARSGKLLFACLCAAVTSLAFSAVFAPASFAIGNGECTVTLEPVVNTNEVGGQQTLTATVTGYYQYEGPFGVNDNVEACSENGPVEGLSVDFVLTSGPHAGDPAVAPQTDVTDVNGKATISYPGTLVGTDTWHAEVNIDDGECVRCDSSIVTYSSNESNITWISTPPVVVQGNPVVSLSKAKGCNSRNKFRVRPTTANGTVANMTIYVDGAKKNSVNASVSAFTINAAKYGPGTHTIKVVTTFTNGRVAINQTKFSRCKARTTARRVAPRFTG